MWVGLATKVKTLRLPEDVCQTVESFPGENFTEKFVAAARLLGRDRERLIKENAILEEKRKQQYVKLCDMDKLLRKRDNIQRGLEEIGWRMSDVVHTCRTVSEVVNEWTAQDTSKQDASVAGWKGARWVWVQGLGVTDMAGTMLTTMAANPILGIFIGVPIVGAIVGVVGILMRRRH